MAPNTRSKARESASANGPRDPASDSPDSNSNLAVVVPVQSSTKKRKRKASEQTTRPKKRSRLQALPDMPIDILIEIFSVLDLRSLVNISKTTKAFRNLVLSPDFASCWKTSYDVASDEDDIPPCPKDAQLIPWAMLVLGSPCCHLCGKTCQRKISFALRMRICIKCMRDEQKMKVVELRQFKNRGFRDTTIYEILPAIPDPNQYFKPRTYYAKREQFEKIEEAVEEIYKAAMKGSDRFDQYKIAYAAVDTYLQKCCEDYRERYNHALSCEEWQDRVEEEQEDRRESVRIARKEVITSRLLSIGYTEDDMRSSKIWEVKGVIVARPLKEDAWEPLFQKFKSSIENQRGYRLLCEASQRHKERKSAASTAFFDFLMAGAILREEFERITQTKDYEQLEPIAHYLEADVPMTDEWHVKLQATFNDALVLARDKFEERKTRVISLIPPPPAMVEGTTLGPMQMLDLATTVFQEEWVLSRNDVTRRLFFGSRILEVNRHRDCAASRCSFSQIGYDAVTQLLSILRLPLTTTFQDLVDLDACFLCTLCVVNDPYLWTPDSDRRARTVCSWTHAIAHYAEYHSDSGRALASTLHRLTDNEVAWLRDYSKRSYFSPPRDWVCSHCKVYAKRVYVLEYEYNRMTKRDVQIHLRDEHKIDQPRQHFDFFLTGNRTFGILDGATEKCNILVAALENLSQQSNVPTAAVDLAV